MIQYIPFPVDVYAKNEFLIPSSGHVREISLSLRRQSLHFILTNKIEIFVNEIDVLERVQQMFAGFNLTTDDHQLLSVPLLTYIYPSQKDTFTPLFDQIILTIDGSKIKSKAPGEVHPMTIALESFDERSALIEQQLKEILEIQEQILSYMAADGHVLKRMTDIESKLDYINTSIDDYQRYVGSPQDLANILSSLSEIKRAFRA